LTRNQSYDQTPKPQARPTLPRSRSLAYIHKHSRTPSIADNQIGHDQALRSRAPAKPSLQVKGDHLLLAADHLTFSPIGSISPEDGDDRGRRREIEHLAETLRESIPEQKHRHSPTRLGQTNGTSALRALTPEAIKVVHSRSNSEMKLVIPGSELTPSTQSSPGDSDDDGLEMTRGPLVRKKSGELVRPALRGPARRRPSSAPGTPTFPKAVHFNEDIEQVRHFLQVDRPIAVSAGSSPVETYDSESDYSFSENKKNVEWEIRTKNFPADSVERQCLPIRVERITLSKDHKTLLGSVAVANLAFEKSVTARFTFDYWKTTSEIAAEYSTVKPQKGVSDGFDRFQFAIKLSDQANLQDKTLYICVRYNVGGQEHWDSNGGKNFQVDFIKKVGPKPWVRPPHLAAIPRSRHNSVALPRPKSFPAAGNDEEFSTSYSSPYHPRQSAENTLRIHAEPGTSEAAQRNASGRLSNRYDFNASLHAALTTAQNALGERSGLTRSDLTRKPPKQPRQQPRAAPVAVTVPKPAPKGSSRDRPDLNSAEYKDLLQKFCYFGSQAGSAAPTTTASPQNKDAPSPSKAADLHQTDGAADSGSESKTSSSGSSASNSPPSPVAQLHQPMLMLEDKQPSRSPTPSLRALSPRLLPYRSPSPAVNSAYQEFPHQGLSVQTTQC
jgi:hypothetical protein